LFIVVIPLAADVIISAVLPAARGHDFAMSKNLFAGYLKLTPWYIVYLIIAFVILYLIKQFTSSKKG
jgi:hypothetical protein